MKIEIEQPEHAYHVLEYVPALRDESLQREPWMQTDSEPEKENLKKVVGLSYGPVALYNPFQVLIINFKRVHNLYSMFAFVVARKSSAFKGMSDVFGDGVRKLGYEFSETSKDATGFVIDSNKRIVVAVYDPKKKVRDIGIGCNGAVPRRFGNLNNFKESASMLEEIVNIFVNGSLSLLIKSKRIPEIPNFKDISLYATPQN